MNFKYALSMVPMLAAVAILSGCGQSAEEPTQPAQTITDSESSEAGDNKHSGWWCVEHGIPEEDCGMCSTKLAAEFQKNGDWCKEHDRPESQCFICNPELETQFAALYEAKYGKKPPKPTE